MLKNLLEKLINRHEQIRNFSREMLNVRKNQLEVLKMKNLKMKVKNAPDGLISRLTLVKESVVDITQLKDKVK